jgi:acyl-CoA reductase-like NAD-dependent aldehyde dehydrogenase
LSVFVACDNRHSSVHRSAIQLRISARIREQIDELALAETTDNGKPP